MKPNKYEGVRLVSKGTKKAEVIVHAVAEATDGSGRTRTLSQTIHLLRKGNRWMDKAGSDWSDFPALQE